MRAHHDLPGRNLRHRMRRWRAHRMPGRSARPLGLRRHVDQQPELRVLRHRVPVRRVLCRRHVQLRGRAYSVRGSERRGWHLRQRAIEQHELRGLRKSVPCERSAVFRRALRHPMHSSDDAVPRKRVRRSHDEQDQLRILRRELRRESHLHEWCVRVRRPLHQLRRRLRERDDRQYQLRNLRDHLRSALDLPERHVPVASTHPHRVRKRRAP